MSPNFNFDKNLEILTDLIEDLELEFKIHLGSSIGKEGRVFVEFTNEEEIMSNDLLSGLVREEKHWLNLSKEDPNLSGLSRTIPHVSNLIMKGKVNRFDVSLLKRIYKLTLFKLSYFYTEKDINGKYLILSFDPPETNRIKSFFGFD